MQEKVDIATTETQRLPRVNVTKLLEGYQNNWMNDKPEPVKIMQDEEDLVTDIQLARMNSQLQYGGIFLSVLIGHSQLQVKQITNDKEKGWLDLLCSVDNLLVEHIKVPWHTTFHLNFREKMFLR